MTFYYVEAKAKGEGEIEIVPHNDKTGDYKFIELIKVNKFIKDLIKYNTNCTFRLVKETTTTTTTRGKWEVINN